MTTTFDRLLPSNPRVRQAVGVVAAAIGTLVLVEVLFPAIGGTQGTPTAVLFQAFVLGLAASLSAAAIVIIYRSIRIINFAQLAVGTAGAQLCFQMLRYVPRVPFAVSVGLSLVLAAGTGVLIDLMFGRRFARAPRLVMTVVTIVAAVVVGGTLTGGILRLPFFPPLASRPATELSGANSLRAYLPFPGLSFGVGHAPLRFGFSELFAIEVSIVALLLLGAFLKFAKAGIALRAVAENTERAALLGVGVGSMTTLAWAMAGLLGGCTSILVGFVSVPGAAFGFNPDALLAPLIGATLGRFRNIPVAVGATLLLTIIAQAWQFNIVRDASLITAGYLVVLLVGLIVVRKGMFREDLGTTAAWDASEEVRPIPKEFDSVLGLRVAKYIVIAVAIGGLLLVPFVSSTGVTVLAQTIALAGIVALSLVILTGWAGQVSLGQYGFVALGVLLGGGLVAKADVPFWFALPITAFACGFFALIIGIPALRVRGLLLGVVTFAFSLAADAVLFDKRYFAWLLPTTGVARPTAFFLNFNDERSMYYLCLGAFVMCVIVLVNLRRSRFGRLLIAVRENESNVQSFGVPLVRTKLAAFMISGAMCGVAGAFFAVQLRAVTGQGFGAGQSFNIFVYAIVGGVTSVLGVVLGVAYTNIAGYTLQRNIVLQFLAQSIPLVIIYIQPAGMIKILTGLRDSVLRVIAQRRRMVVPSLFADYDAEVVSRQLIPIGEPITGTGLAALGGARRFALASSLHARAGMAREESSPLTPTTTGVARDAIGEPA